MGVAQFVPRIGVNVLPDDTPKLLQAKNALRECSQHVGTQSASRMRVPSVPTVCQLHSAGTNISYQCVSHLFPQSVTDTVQEPTSVTSAGEFIMLLARR